ncbi:hypothetical protein DR081_03085, partial [Mycoplasma sp. MF12]|nr:hypothetical protein [Mycoplasma sp. MF12]
KKDLELDWEARKFLRFPISFSISLLFTPAHDIFDVRDLNSFSKLIYYGKKQDRYTLNLLPIPILRSEILNSLTINFTYPQI